MTKYKHLGKEYKERHFYNKTILFSVNAFGLFRLGVSVSVFSYTKLYFINLVWYRSIRMLMVLFEF